MLLEVYKFRICATVTSSLYLPEYKGSTFRGAFGKTFFDISCVNRGSNCYECILKDKCAYTYIFNPFIQDSERFAGAGKSNFKGIREIPQPFVIEPPLEDKRIYVPSEKLEFFFIVIGEAVKYLPYFIFTFCKMGEVGIGKHRGKYEVDKVCILKDGQEQKIYTKQEGKLSKIPVETLFFNFETKAEGINNISINFLTPTRMRVGGKLLEYPEFHHLITFLLRRISLLSSFYCGKNLYLGINDLIAKSQTVKIIHKDVNWKDWERYSSRQCVRMKLGGFVGKMKYEGEIGEFMQILKMGELIHIGKNCTFGLGKYIIE